VPCPTEKQVEAFKGRCLGEPQGFSKFQNGDRPRPQVDGYHETSRLAESTIRSRAQDIGRDINRLHRQPRHDSCGELIENCRHFTDDKQQGETGVERSSALGVKQSDLLSSFLALALTVSAN